MTKTSHSNAGLATDLSEQDISPAELVEDQKIACLQDVGRLLSHRGEFVSVSCPACGSLNFEKKFEKIGFNYVECANCSTLFVNPRPSSTLLESFYQTSDNYAYWNQFMFPATEDARRMRIMVPRADHVIDLCDRYGFPCDSILEVGAGFGTFCVEMASRNRFKRIVAVEPTPDLANSCRDKGVDVIELPIEKITFPEEDKFDVIVSFEVLEHLYCPSDFIRQASTFLKPTGLLRLTCPNGLGFDIQQLGVISDCVDHEHLNYFNPRSIGILMASCGFEVIESMTPGRLDAELVRNKVLAGEYSLEDGGFLSRVLIEEWARLGAAFQKFLVDNKLSTHMWIAAKNSRSHSTRRLK